MRHSRSGSSAPHAPLLAGFDSPTSAAAGVGGLGGLNIAGLNGTPTATGIGAVAPDAGFGVAGVSARDNDGERRRRIEVILNLLARRPGVVSEEGVERLAKRTGLECLWEGRRTLSIAGNNVLVDVDFRGGDRVEKVGLSFPTCKMPSVADFAETGAQVLQRDLQTGKGEERGYKMLDPFADNLERLARLDKLSSDGANCFEAVAGIYTSLRKIFEYEENKIRRVIRDGMEAVAAEMEVWCKRSGRPRMHARRRVGLNVDYWMERRLVQGRKREAENVDVDMDESRQPRKFKSEADEEEESKVWSAIVECEASPAELYPSIRVSDNWVSADIETMDESRDALFPAGVAAPYWLDPSPTLTSSNSTGDDMVMDSGVPPTAKPPDVRFVVRLEPALVVPLQTAVEIYGSVGVTVPQDSIRPTTYEELLLPGVDTGSSLGHTEDGQFVIERRITAFNSNGGATERQHRNTLYTPKTEFGRLIKEIPFSHPRQLVAILPVLRQWALVGSILQRSFVLDSGHKDNNNATTPSSDAPTQKSSTSTKARDAAEELALLMADADPADTEGETAVSVDVSLTTLPTPKVVVLFDLRGALANVEFEILPNAEIRASEVTSNTSVLKPRDADDTGAETRPPAVLMGAAAVSKVLAISEDVGVVVEWVRRKCAASG